MKMVVGDGHEQINGCRLCSGVNSSWIGRSA